jgi:hypothetical protein
MPALVRSTQPTSDASIAYGRNADTTGAEIRPDQLLYSQSLRRLPAAPAAPVTPTAIVADDPHNMSRLQTDGPFSRRNVFTLLQQWEGVVSSEPKNENFVAVLRDLTDRSRPEEQATFAVDQVSPVDRSLIVPGGVFYWSIGYEDTLAGQRKTESILRFRRLPAWSRRDLERIKRRVQRFQYLFEGAD